MPTKADYNRQYPPRDKRGLESAATVSLLDPLSMGSLAHWWDAGVGLYQDVAMSLASSVEGNPVGIWQNRVGAVQLSQSVDSARPLLRLSQANGYRVVRFDGVNDYLSGTGTIAPPFSWLACLRLNGTTGSTQGLFSSNNFPVGGLSSSLNSSLTTLSLFGLTGLTVTLSGFTVLAAVRDTTTGFAYQGTTSLGSASGLSTSSINNPLLASATTTSPDFFASLDVAEVLVYSRAMSTTDLLTVITYLKTKYAA